MATLWQKNFVGVVTFKVLRLRPSQRKCCAVYIQIYTKKCDSHSGDSQDYETFLAPSADKQTHNFDTECPNHHPSQSS